MEDIDKIDRKAELKHLRFILLRIDKVEKEILYYETSDSFEARRYTGLLGLYDDLREQAKEQKDKIGKLPFYFPVLRALDKWNAQWV